MEYGKLIAVTGLPGLFELVSSKNDGAIVRSLEDNSTKFASTRQHQFSHLESIEVYTIRENVNLIDIFKAMQADGGKLPDEKDAKAVKAYFEKVYPDLDFERVYASDMKKMVKWFGVITAKGIELKLTEQLLEEEAPVEEAVVAEAEETKPAKKAAKKKAEAPAEEAGEEAPKKKTTRKKKED